MRGCRTLPVFPPDSNNTPPHLRAQGHFLSPNPWVAVDELAPSSLARLVGALPEEVVAMNTLTANLHFLMVPFYTPTKTRFKIIIEAKSFPSDYVSARGGGRCAHTVCRDVTPSDAWAASLSTDIFARFVLPISLLWEWLVIFPSPG